MKDLEPDLMSKYAGHYYRPRLQHAIAQWHAGCFMLVKMALGVKPVANLWNNSDTMVRFEKAKIFVGCFLNFLKPQYLSIFISAFACFFLNFLNNFNIVFSIKYFA